jgi:hypothetical protein
MDIGRFDLDKLKNELKGDFSAYESKTSLFDAKISQISDQQTETQAQILNQESALNQSL